MGLEQRNKSKTTYTPLQTAFRRKLLFAGFLVPSSFEVCAGLGNGCERFAHRDLC